MTFYFFLSKLDAFFFSFKKILVCVHVCAWVYGECLEVKGQLLGVGY